MGLLWLAVAAPLALPAVLLAQQPAAAPDLSGVWNLRNSPQTRYLSYSFMGEEPPMTEWAQEKFKLTRPSFGPRSFKDSNDPVNPTTLNTVGCFPPGTPRIYLQPFPMEIIQTPGRLMLFYEFNHFIRQIWTDGRPHNTDLGNTWFGDSIGKWEGDTLVVDTIGINDKSWIDRAGHPHSDQLHVVERMKRTDAATLQIDLTFEDAKAYTKPWGGRLIFQRHPTWNITEMVCEDNVNFDEFLKNEAKGAK
ncbi:MAG: hypothetical protein C5B51_21730 [Terriglobia bacterium]|nr:MAG: hypothetical protein C5B51_21730 [Terriglobia bacterium]